MRDRSNGNPVETFYDAFTHKLLKDYASGNLRMEAAITFAVRQLRLRGSRAVLDIGCGVGWSAHEVVRGLPSARVRGLDLSGHSIAVARALFARPELEFERADVTRADWAPPALGCYDACIMLDVFEHLPTAFRPCFAAALARLLAPAAQLILTCPSPAHQVFLREQQPEGLQPVDEDVTARDLLELADQLGGKLAHYELKTVWRPGDYFHACIVRGGADFHSTPLLGCNSPISLEPRRQRARRIKRLRGMMADEAVRTLSLKAHPAFRTRIASAPRWLGTAWRRLRRGISPQSRTQHS